MTAHIHAHAIALYALDALETETPWERWGSRAQGDQSEFKPELGPLVFNECREYRRIGKTIQIGGIAVPEPMRTEPAEGIEYWVPNFYQINLPTPWAWIKGCGHIKLGIAHATREGAVAHAKALVAVSGGTSGEGSEG